MSGSVPVQAPRSGRHVPLFGIGLALLFGAASYLLAISWPLLFPRAEFHAEPAPQCDLATDACAAAFDAQRFIRLKMRPQDYSPSSALPVVVDTAGFAVDTLSIEFSGVDMNMGLIRHELVDTGGGSFAGDVVLPVCVRRQMRWRAIVNAAGADGVHRATFTFDVNRR